MLMAEKEKKKKLKHLCSTKCLQRLILRISSKTGIYNIKSIFRPVRFI